MEQPGQAALPDAPTYVVPAYPSSPSVVCWALLAFSYFVVGFVFYGNELVLQHNLNGMPVRLGPSLLLIPLAFAAIALGWKLQWWKLVRTRGGRSIGSCAVG